MTRFYGLALMSALSSAGAARSQVIETVLHSFASTSRGANPISGVIRDSAGNLYGTASEGGTANAGAVYEVDSAGNQKVLYDFTGGADGGYPYGGLIRDSAGNLYGTTYAGGKGWGTVFKLSPSGHETVLYSFAGPPDAGGPEAGLIRDSSGNLYGTTYFGGTADKGAVYKLDTSGNETILYSFTGGFQGTTDGGNPYGGVVLDSAGSLYGTTVNGGTTGWGVIFKIDSAGHETVLHDFNDPPGSGDGVNPYSDLLLDSAGNIYGVTIGGGSGSINNCSTYGCGVLYKLDAAGRYKVVYSFPGGAGGSEPYGRPIRDAAGNFYGTTYQGGSSPCFIYGCGVVYKVSGAAETVVYSFTGGADGAHPMAGLTRDSEGNLYGVTFGGGTSGSYSAYNGVQGLGVVFKLDTAGQQTVMYTFPGTDGQAPSGRLLRDTSGNLYGTTSQGGAANMGTVYRLDSAGHETVLYSFTGGVDGANPAGGVIGDSAGNLYGTAVGGGTHGFGVVYKVDATRHQSVLYNFTGAADGANPGGELIRDVAGNLYGTAGDGGDTTGLCPTFGCGVVYKLDASGNQTVLHTFSSTDGEGPVGGVIRDTAGNIYGTTGGAGPTGIGGTVFKIDPSGNETVLYGFCSEPTCSDGGFPWAGVIRDSFGNLYGTTTAGGLGGTGQGSGVVYKLDTAGNEKVLHKFCSQPYCADGASPTAGVILDSAGNLYGTAPSNAPFSGPGVVYKLDTTRKETVLYNFTAAGDGREPGGLILDSAGNLYGTTLTGGKANQGIVFELPGAAAPR